MFTDVSEHTTSIFRIEEVKHTSLLFGPKDGGSCLPESSVTTGLTERCGSSGGPPDLYFGGVWFASRKGHRVSFFCGPSLSFLANTWTGP
jgi:hypothetical protein